MAMDKIKNVLLEDIENLSVEDKQLHGHNLKKLISTAKTMRELKKIQITLDILLNRNLEALAA